MVYLLVETLGRYEIIFKKRRINWLYWKWVLLCGVNGGPCNRKGFVSVIFLPCGRTKFTMRFDSYVAAEGRRRDKDLYRLYPFRCGWKTISELGLEDSWGSSIWFSVVRCTYLRVARWHHLKSIRWSWTFLGKSRNHLVGIEPTSRGVLASPIWQNPVVLKYFSRFFPRRQERFHYYIRVVVMILRIW